MTFSLSVFFQTARLPTHASWIQLASMPHLARAAEGLDGMIQVGCLVVPARHDLRVIPVVDVRMKVRVVPVYVVREVGLNVRTPGVLWHLVRTQSARCRSALE